MALPTSPLPDPHPLQIPPLASSGKRLPLSRLSLPPGSLGKQPGISSTRGIPAPHFSEMTRMPPLGHQAEDCGLRKQKIQKSKKAGLISNILDIQSMARAKVEHFDDGLVDLAVFAKAMSHPARLQILRDLAKSGEAACMEIVERLPLSQPACSRHINELLRVGLLESRNVRTQIRFRVREQALAEFCAGMSGILHP